MIRRELEIKNRLGLHARAAALLVQAVARFDAQISVRKDDQTVDGKSIISLMMLAASQGTRLEVTAEGPEEAAAMEALVDLAERKFNED